MRTRACRVVVLLPLLGAGVPGEALAQPDDDTRKRAVAVRVAPGSIRVDGRLDDRAWHDAPAVVDFVQAEPDEGAPPTDTMEVRFAYDDEALFVGARMASRNAGAIQAPMSRRDESVNQAEHIFVSLDTYLDRRTAYTFGVTAAGVRFDHFHASDNRSSRDRGFDPVWEARVTVDADGWTAEMRIPFQQLRFAARDEQVFGLNIYRAVPSRNEEVYWVLVRRTERVWASRFGELHGIAGIAPARRLELLPYAAASSRLDGAADPRNPFAGGAQLHARGGLDAKVGLGSNITLEATVNPDFGQVEADPAEVNLTAFETFFSERRPFFLEGSRLLGAAGGGNPWEGGGGAQYFYSRRIGARPPGSIAGDFVDHPDASTILGAAKVTGRLPSGTSIGLLGALTGEEFARASFLDSGAVVRGRVAPRTLYGVGRVQQEFGPAQSTAAVMVTAVHRDLPAADPLAGRLPRDAFTASAESLLRFRGGEYEVGLNLGMSHVAGDAPAITGLQRSSARYFQRPDAGYVRLDPSRTSLTGVAGGVSIERAQGRHWLWEVSAGAVSPEFETNDLGRLSRADLIEGSAQIQYRETQPGRLFRGYSLTLEHERGWNFGGDLQESSVRADGEVTWRNFWTTELGLNLEWPAQDARLTRGGPTMGTPRGWFADIMVRNNPAARTRAFVRFEYGENEDGGFGVELRTSLTVRPTERWQLSLSPGYLRDVNDRQYVAALDGGRPETYGRRYVFAYVDRSTVSAEVRLNYVFKPDVTLEFYAEPFAASGRYYDFAELAAPGTRDRRWWTRLAGDSLPPGLLAFSEGEQHLTLRDRDFNVLSFRSNLVLRWEWRLGSTLYVVWQQDRGRSEVRPDRVGLGDMLGSLGAPGRHVLAVKTTLWLGGL